MENKDTINHEERTVAADTHKEILGATRETLVIDDTIARRVVRKYDLRILPLFLLINLFSFIDRVNIGNARILGLQTDLQLGVGLRYNIALMCLFVSYCVVELPSNIVCKKVGGHVWIPFLVFCFSVLTICTSVVESRGGLYAVRFLLGCFEGGISPGLVWMLSQFYRREELGFRTSIYISAASASGAFGGLLAIGLSSIPRWGLIHTWRNIFLFEVSFALVCAQTMLTLPGIDLASYSCTGVLANPKGTGDRKVLERGGEECSCGQAQS